MTDINFWAVLVATAVAFVAGPIYYALLGKQLATVSDAFAADERPPPWKLAIEVLRSFIIVAVVTGLVSVGGISGWSGGLLLGLALWIGFPLVLWIGAIIWENAHWKLAAIHAGDWLVKLLVVAVIISIWQ